MAASASGIITLLAIILVGPLYYACLHFYRNSMGIVVEKKEPQTDDEDRDIIDTSHYLFALVGYAIGVGNIWRFPYVIAQHGGGAALVAYIVSAALVACPLFFYEMIVGQHIRLSTIRCYEKIRPRWESLGVASGFMLFVAMSYYGMVIAYTLPYIGGSLITPLPWVEGGAESYWSETVLNSVDKTETVSGLGPVQGNLVLCLFLMWAIVFLTVAFGREVLAKITVVTVILPVGLIFVMVMRTVFLEGAGDGIRFYIGRFEIEYLFNMRTWAAALGQALFSMSPGLGTVITYSSYAKPKEDVYRACLVVSFSNCLFSIFAAFSTFAVVGHMAKEEGLEVEDLATKSGSGLAFVTMAEAMKYFGSASNVMSVLFFSTLFLLGLDSAYAMEQTLTSYGLDFWDERGWPKPKRWKMSLGTCVITALTGLVYTTRKGNILLEVIDHFIGSQALLYVAFSESIMLILDFTYKRLEFALAKATYNNPLTPDGRKLPSCFCKFDFYFFVPAMSGILFLYLMILDFMEGYNDHPSSILAVGWSILAIIILMSILTLYRTAPSTLEPFDDEDIKINDSEKTKSKGGGEVGPELQLTEVI